MAHSQQHNQPGSNLADDGTVDGHARLNTRCTHARTNNSLLTSTIAAARLNNDTCTNDLRLTD